MADLFFSQKALDQWTSEGKIMTDGSTLRFLAHGCEMALKPAVHFLRIVSDPEDPHGLLHRVRSEEHLSEMGAEIYMDSVLLGEQAYEVDPGFIGQPLEAQAAVPAPTSEAAPAPTSEAAPEAAPPAAAQAAAEMSDEELLKKFLLENL